MAVTAMSLVKQRHLIAARPRIKDLVRRCVLQCEVIQDAMEKRIGRVQVAYPLWGLFEA